MAHYLLTYDVGTKHGVAKDELKKAHWKESDFPSTTLTGTGSNTTSAKLAEAVWKLLDKHGCGPTKVVVVEITDFAKLP